MGTPAIAETLHVKTSCPFKKEQSAVALHIPFFVHKDVLATNNFIIYFAQRATCFCLQTRSILLYISYRNVFIK